MKLKLLAYLQKILLQILVSVLYQYKIARVGIVFYFSYYFFKRIRMMFLTIIYKNVDRVAITKKPYSKEISCLNNCISVYTIPVSKTMENEIKNVFILIELMNSKLFYDYVNSYLQA